MPELDNTSQVIDTAPPPVGAITETAPVVTEAATPDWEAANDAELNKIWKTNNPLRDEEGRFDSATPKDETKPPDQPASEEGKTEPPSIPVPNSWSADVREKWATLSPDVQAYIAKREKEASDALSQQGMQVKEYEPIRSVLEQHKDIFERNGMDFADGLGRLMSAERLLEQNPVAAIAQIAQAYGVDLRQFNGQQQPQNSAESALHQRIASLESQLNNTATRIEQREKAEAKSDEQARVKLIEKFSADKPDWADLENDIFLELSALNQAMKEGVIPPMSREDHIKQAYERAQRANPAAWEKKLAADKEAEEKKRMEAAKKNADDLKRAKSVNVNGSPLNGGRTVNSMDDDLMEIARKAYSN